MSEQNGGEARSLFWPYSTFFEYKHSVLAVDPAQEERLDRCEDTLHIGLDLLHGLELANLRLTEAGRPDLNLAERVTMLPINNPNEVIDKTNNFPAGFRIHTEVNEFSQLKPITAAELPLLKQTPKIKGVAHAVELEESGKYPGLHLNNHTVRPAFIRMLNLFPEFTSNLVLDMSQPENWLEAKSLEPEIFVAYQLMSRLVDGADPYARHSDGSVDDLHLIR